MWLAFLINLTAYRASGGLLPYIAQRVYQVDATGLGWLAAAFSFGALLASIAMVVTGGPAHPERYTLVHTVLWDALLLVFPHLPNLGGGLLVLPCTRFVHSLPMISMTPTLPTPPRP